MEKTSLIAALLLTALGCRGVSDNAPTLDGPVDTGDTEGHPLVPDDYTYYWNTGPCTDADGNAGVQAYWLGEGSIDAAGELTVTERWFWFFGEPDYTGDCVDTFQLVGSLDQSGTEPGALGCSICDDVWSVQRVLISDTCGRSYDPNFGVSPDDDNDGIDDEQTTDAHLLLDTQVSESESNAGNAMLVAYAEARDGGGYDSDASYATGTAVYDESAGTWAIEWLGSRCIVE